MTLSKQEQHKFKLGVKRFKEIVTMKCSYRIAVDRDDGLLYNWINLLNMIPIWRTKFFWIL